MRSAWLVLLSCIGMLMQAQDRPPTFARLDSTVIVHVSHRMFDGALFPSNGLLVLTRDSVVLIDSGWGTKATRRILRYVRRTLHRPVAACISTHFHADRTGGIPVLRQHGVRCLGTTRTRELALARGEGVPDVTVAADTLLTIDGLPLHVLHPGPGHAPDNVVVWLPRQRILFGGCLVKSTEAQGLGNTADADLARWPDAIRTLQQRFPDARTVVPGHQAWGGPELLTHTLDLLGVH